MIASKIISILISKPGSLLAVLAIGYFLGHKNATDSCKTANLKRQFEQLDKLHKEHALLESAISEDVDAVLSTEQQLVALSNELSAQKMSSAEVITKLRKEVSDASNKSSDNCLSHPRPDSMRDALKRAVTVSVADKRADSSP